MSTRRALIALFAGALLAGCAEERPTINRVQPYAMKKSFFVGPDLKDDKDNPEFWTQATLIDVGYGAAQLGLFNSTFTQNLSRIRWQITEDYLFARLAYERVEGSDGKGAGKATNDGQIVAAFRIEKHFDVVRDYNPTTGEQLNVLNENTTDRPWYERAYMRVDWSKNEATDTYDFDTLSLLGAFGGVTYEPLAYDVTKPDDPHAPLFALDQGYFDVTNKAFAKPAMVDLSHFGWGIEAFPACYLEYDFLGGSWPGGTCSPAELTVRHSFRRVEDHDYEPVHWDGYRFQAYGAFLKERYGYAQVNGRRVELGNYMSEPSGIFMGRGEHPLRGRWKEGATQADVTLNLSPDAPRPPGDWGEIVWQPESLWVARWLDKLSDKLKCRTDIEWVAPKTLERAAGPSAKGKLVEKLYEQK